MRLAGRVIKKFANLTHHGRGCARIIRGIRGKSTINNKLCVVEEGKKAQKVDINV